MYERKLKALEKLFFEQYPLGYRDEIWLGHVKKHRLSSIHDTAQHNFSEAAFDNPMQVFADYVALIKKSSMVSVFEKVKFKDYAASFSTEEKRRLVLALADFLYGDRAAGFANQVELLAPYKIAKWPILTALPTYLRPHREVFIKPTTVKAILKYFEIADFTYSAKANYPFYESYRQFMLQLIGEAPDKLKATTPEFSGFLMSTLL